MSSPMFLLPDGTGGEAATCKLLAGLHRPCFVLQDAQACPPNPPSVSPRLSFRQLVLMNSEPAERPAVMISLRSANSRALWVTQEEESWQAASLAEHVAQQLRGVQRLLPRPACVLAGIGCGAAVAHELGVQLQAAGVEVINFPSQLIGQCHFALACMPGDPDCMVTHDLLSSSAPRAGSHEAGKGV